MRGTGTTGETNRVGAGAPSAFAGEADQAVLDETLNEIAGHLNAQHARLVDATVELLAHPERWRGDGVWTPTQYLCWRVGVAPHRARQIVEIAERVDELPICFEAFRRGELTVDAMAAIAKRAPWWTDKTARTYGTTMTISQLRRVLAKYPFPDIPHPDDDAMGDNTTDDESAVDPVDADAHDETAADDGTSGDGTSDDGTSGGSNGRTEPHSSCRFGWDDTRRFNISVDTDAATGAIIEAALTEARDALFQRGQTDVAWLDAFREVCERSLDSVIEPSRRDRFRINIHLDTGATTPEATDATGWRLPDAVRRHLTCDGLLSPVFTDKGMPISVGRTQRIVPDRTRRQVVLRDGGCGVIGCTDHMFIEIHHIIHWQDGGPTDTWNLICLCPHHHRLHHRGKLGIAGNADVPGGVTFTNAAGNPIAQTGTRPEPPEAPPPRPAGTYRHPLGERLDTSYVYFNPPRRHRGDADFN